jgi:hemoglobin-like flavoprotein
VSADADTLRSSWTMVLEHGEQVPLFFYSHLALSRPDLRELFPVAMASQRDKFVVALGRIVAQADQADHLGPYLEELGRRHLGYGAEAAHYDPVGTSLLATLAYFLDEHWTPELADAWQDAYALVASVMQGAAAAPPEPVTTDEPSRSTS